MTENDKKIQRMCIKIVRTLDDYMDNNNGDKEGVKLAVVMSAMTRILATMAASLGMPQEMVIAALIADMESAHESMAEDEVKH
jgi:regulator of PEP synthase PpsR (kinase-PPPase family)